MTDLEYKVLKFLEDHPKAEGYQEYEIVKGTGMDPCKNHTGFFTKLYNRRWISESFTHSPRYYLTDRGYVLLRKETNRRTSKCQKDSKQI